MSSKIDIYNLALTHLGMKEVTSVDANNPSADALNTLYNPCLEDLFSEYRWPFATVKEKLVSVTDTVLELEWENSYLRPTEAMTVWVVYNEGTMTAKEEQQFETIYQPTYSRRIIGTNLDDAYCEYTYKIIDTALYSPKFVMALSYKLAASAAHTLLRTIKSGTDIMTIARAFIEEAKAISFSEKINKREITSSYRNSR